MDISSGGHEAGLTHKEMEQAYREWKGYLELSEMKEEILYLHPEMAGMPEGLLEKMAGQANRAFREAMECSDEYWGIYDGLKREAAGRILSQAGMQQHLRAFTAPVM